ncbi:MAG: tRNA (adenosine(37)-N6)-dimethylallyltransferase MiaA [Chloroflexi bacterium]|nr:tRNA (adenosine(37)-N6)-dimethylallyltransferase MiaA [Chloroflexota bacterium]
MIPVLAIVGPTAAGKSSLALALACRLRGEIVSTDSRQVYRFMDIGTAKPSREDRAAVPHHLIDLVDPDQPFTVADYRRLALAAIKDIHRRGALPILVGGAGLYLRVLTQGLTVPAVPPDPAFRRAQEGLAEREGPQALHARLAEVDPAAARRIHPHNLRRVIRALEVWEATGQPISQLQGTTPPPVTLRKVGLTAPRATLYRWIDQRVDRMLAAGLVTEVRDLVARGYRWELPAMSSLGYRQIGEYLRGEVDLPTAVQRLKYETHRFARQQHAWFRPDDPSIQWFSLADETLEKIVDTILREISVSAFPHKREC